MTAKEKELFLGYMVAASQEKGARIFRRKSIIWRVRVWVLRYIHRIILWAASIIVAKEIYFFIWRLTR